MILLDIKIMNENCARITVEPWECEYIGICYENFSPDSPQAGLFLISALTKLEAMTFLPERPEKISAEVFERSDGGLVIYFSAPSRKNVRHIKEDDADSGSVIVFREPDSAAAFAAAAMAAGGKAALYKSDERYALVSDKNVEGWDSDEIAIAKITEYWDKINGDAAKRLLDL